MCELAFDPSREHLFGVGDLVDRGPHSHEALAWLERRFEAVVMGNHERPLLYWFSMSMCRSYSLGRFPSTRSANP